MAERTEGPSSTDQHKPSIKLPFETIHRVADEIDAGIIVVGTHGRKRLARALLGSIAEKTIRTATRPVVVVHKRERQTDGAARASVRDGLRPS